MRVSLYLLLFIFIGFSCQQKNQLAPPLVDGKLDDFKVLNVKPIALSEDVDLYIYQNDHYVWLGYDYPNESFGTLDLQIVTDKIVDTLNLHVSAQLGEWVVGNDKQKPDNSTSDLWWEINGWYSNEVWANGLETVKDKKRIKFKNAEAREIQLSKERFGKGEWKIKFDIGMITDSNGKRYNIDYPEGEDFFSLEVR